MRALIYIMYLGDLYQVWHIINRSFLIFIEAELLSQQTRNFFHEIFLIDCMNFVSFSDETIKRNNLC